MFRMTRLVPLAEIDFVTGQREIEDDMANEQARFAERKRGFGGRLLDHLF